MIWNKLNTQQQDWLKEAAVESAEYEKTIWREAELHALEEIQKAGVEVTYPDKEAFREKVAPMYDKFKEDPVMKKTIEAIQAVD